MELLAAPGCSGTCRVDIGSSSVAYSLAWLLPKGARGVRVCTINGMHISATTMVRSGTMISACNRIKALKIMGPLIDITAPNV